MSFTVKMFTYILYCDALPPKTAKTRRELVFVTFYDF